MVLRYLDAELLGVGESNSGLPRVIGKYHRYQTVNHMTTGRPESRKRKFDDMAETVVNPENPGKIHIERPALRAPQDLVPVIKNLIKLVRTLKETGARVLVICPMPRHFSSCCRREDHFGENFPHEKYLMTVYELSTFIKALPELCDVDILHPGEMLGWGRPVEKWVVKDDGVHLRAPHSELIFNTTLAFIRNQRLKTGGPTNRRTCSAFSPDTFPGFVRVTRSKGQSYQCPKSN